MITRRGGSRTRPYSSVVSSARRPSPGCAGDSGAARAARRGSGAPAGPAGGRGAGARSDSSPATRRVLAVYSVRGSAPGTLARQLPEVQVECSRRLPQDDLTAAAERRPAVQSTLWAHREYILSTSRVRRVGSLGTRRGRGPAVAGALRSATQGRTTTGYGRLVLPVAERAWRGRIGRQNRASRATNRDCLYCQSYCQGADRGWQ